MCCEHFLPLSIAALLFQINLNGTSKQHKCVLTWQLFTVCKTKPSCLNDCSLTSEKSYKLDNILVMIIHKCGNAKRVDWCNRKEKSNHFCHNDISKETPRYLQQYYNNNNNNKIKEQYHQQITGITFRNIKILTAMQKT